MGKPWENVDWESIETEVRARISFLRYLYRSTEIHDDVKSLMWDAFTKDSVTALASFCSSVTIDEDEDEDLI